MLIRLIYILDSLHEFAVFRSQSLLTNTEGGKQFAGIGGLVKLNGPAPLGEGEPS